MPPIGIYRPFYGRLAKRDPWETLFNNKATNEGYFYRPIFFQQLMLQKISILPKV